MTAPAARQSIQLGTHRVLYSVAGEGPAVFCYELPLNPFARFGPLQTCLADRFRTFVVDLRPVIAESNRQPPAEDLLDFLSGLSLGMADALGAKRFAAVGSFMAGPLVMDMAVKAGDRVEGLALLGPLGTISSPATPLLRFITGFYRLPGVPTLLRIGLVKWFAEACDRYVLGPGRMRQIFYDLARAPVTFEDLYEMHKRPPNPHAHVALMWCIRNMKYARVMSRLSEIRCPSLIVHGEDDEWVPVPYVDQLHRRLPQSSLVLVPKTRHAPELEEVDLVCREIEGFLKFA